MALDRDNGLSCLTNPILVAASLFAAVEGTALVLPGQTDARKP
jgi:hypothetical protein